MSTTIDTLEIKIESDASRAADGIEEVAIALGDLKTNGKVGTAVKNLKDLSAALKSFTSVTSNANKISSLAAALQSLKDVGSLKGTGNAVTKMADSLKSLTGVNTVALEKVANSGPLFERVSSALGKLSSIKSGGIGTMVNALGKIGDVTAKLDDKAIDDFAARVAKLSEKLTPLSGKMTTIQAGLRGVNSSAKAAGTGMNSLGTRVNKTALNLASLTTVIQGAIAALRPVINLLTDYIGQAMEWDGVAARFGRGFGDQAQEVYDWIQKLNKEMGINTQTFMQYSSVFATMLQGFGVSVGDSAKMAVGYTELVYDIWAGYNDVYKNFGDAADAVKSAIAGEVEPIRRAGFTIVESTLEQTAANHGLENSLANATEAQKSYLRYLTLVDQAHAQNLIGTYARELNTAEGLTRTLAQQLKSLAQAIGSLFLPILVAVIPWIQAFIEVLIDAIRVLASFFGITIQKVDWGGFNSGISAGAGGVGDLADSAEDATGSLGSAAKAAEDLKKATLGIDELNVISPPTETGGGGGGGGGAGGSDVWDGLDVESLWDESIFGQIQSKVDDIKKKFEEWVPVIEAIGLALAGLAIAKLLNNMGTALAQMDALSSAIAGIAIATIEAALVFIFADDYLETGNLLSLVGEAVATALGSYLLYKTWGDKGLVVGLAVSIAAQLVAITLNLADGGVEMSDPQLWIQSAFTTALAGGAGGWMAYKGLIPMSTGQGIGIGLLVGLSLTLAAITIGDITANGVQFSNALTGALSTLIGGGAGAAIFTALGIATGGTGFLVGAAIMLAVNVIGAIIGTVSKDAEKSVQKDLESRFGNVELTVNEARVLIEKLVPAWVEGVNYAVQLREGVKSLLESIETQEGSLGALEWQVSVGIALTESENEEYKRTIDSFVSNCKSYVAERGYALEIGIKATTSNASIIESANSVSAMATGELEALGKQLQDTVNAAYEDGLLDIDELEAIQNIRNDMREIINALAGSEVEAEFGVLKMKWSGVELTPDSFETMLTEWNDVIQNTIKPNLESTVKENLKTLEGNVTYLKMALEKDPDNTQLQEDLKKAEKALQDYIDENPLEKLTIEANIEAVNFALNTLRDAFAEEIDRIEKEGYLDFGKSLSFALEAYPNVKFDNGDGEIYGNWQIVASAIGDEMDKASESLSKKARENLESMIEAMKPTMADIEGIAAENRKAGKTVPESVRDGINDYNELKAMAGDLDGINYMIGKGFSSDPVFMNTLATVKNAGIEIQGKIREGLLNNIEYIRDDASGVVLAIRDATTDQVTEITPTLRENLSLMGVDMGNALGGKYEYVYDKTTGVLQSIVDSATGNQVWVNEKLKKAGSSSGSSLSAGVLEGAESSMKKSEKSWLDWAIWPWNWFKQENEINSPSKLFERGGKNMSDGLLAGAKNGMKSNEKSWRDWAIWPWNWFKEENKTTQTVNVGVGLKKDGWTTVKGWIGSIPGVSQAVSLAKSGWSSVKGWVGNIPKLSQKIGLAKSGWSTVKKWIGSIPKISQSVGLAKSGWSSVSKWVGSMPTLKAKIGLVKSGWTSIKSWLGNLNFNIGFKLPKIKVKWGEKTYAGFTIKYPNGFETYAKGGFPDMGEMFIAREAGPEMVGRIGNRTTVANNDQIVEGISEGVYAAVVAAMKASENGGSQAVNVYLDGRQIYSSMEQHRKERGASLMGNQVYSY